MQQKEKTGFGNALNMSFDSTRQENIRNKLDSFMEFLKEKKVTPSSVEQRKIRVALSKNGRENLSNEELLDSLNGEGIECIDTYASSLIEADFLSELESAKEENKETGKAPDPAASLPPALEEDQNGVDKESGEEKQDPPISSTPATQAPQDNPPHVKPETQTGKKEETSGKAQASVEPGKEKETQPGKVLSVKKEEAPKKKKAENDQFYDLLMAEYDAAPGRISKSSPHNLSLRTLDYDLICEVADALKPRRGRNATNTINDIPIYSLNTVIHAMMKSFIKDMKEQGRQDVLDILYKTYQDNLDASGDPS